MVAILIGGTQGLVALQEQPFGWEVWERTDEAWWGRRVYALANVASAGALLVGTDVGLLRSTDGGTTWTVVLEQMVRAIAANPRDPARFFAGTQPAAVWRSDDGGLTWRGLAGPGTAEERAAWHLPGDTPIETIPVARIAAFASDPRAPETVYAGVEIGGVWRSDDGGDSWRARVAGLPSLAIHALVPHPLEPETLFAATDTGVYRSVDGGESWADRGFDTGAGYTRALLALAPDGAEERPILLAGPAEVDLWGWDEEPDGARSGLFRSDDDGATWYHLGERHGLPDSFDGLISALAVDSDDAHTLWLGTWDGRVYVSRDRGEGWTQVAEDLGQVWCMLPLVER